MKNDNRTNYPSPFWSVIFPLLVGSILIAALGVWAIITSAGGGDVSRFADLSAVLLIILLGLFFLAPLFLLGAAAYGLFRLYDVIPQGTRWLLGGSRKVQEMVTRAAELTAEPVLRVKSFQAGLQVLFRRRK
ncbi:MAG: hypothetical protein U5K99_01595 [Anaerolineales bacterium]|nr:hypothetical protein [Anaerolineales bacterium]